MIGERYNLLFKKLIKKNEGALIPFIVLGDPNPIISLKIIDILIQSGADALEFGIPFSDPLADGPTIQNAILRSLSCNMNLEYCFQLLLKIRKKYPLIPIGLLVYANLIFNNKINNFYFLCSKIGIDSVLIPDVPIEESYPFKKEAIKNNISPIFICPPNAENNLIKLISINSLSYVYLLSRGGVTGHENKKFQPINNIIYKLKKFNSAPIIQGFGISEPKQIISALKLGISGVIIGSAIINIIENNIKNINYMLKRIKYFIKKMKKCTKIHI